MRVCALLPRALFHAGLACFDAPSMTLWFATVYAYWRGLDRRLTAGKRVDRIASVASFFVSRVDTAVDRLIDEKLRAGAGEATPLLGALRGQAAIANAKLAYAAFRRKFGSERFTTLARSGARVQRPLWASTSTKDPAYPDTYYVEALIGPDTVDTMPPATLTAYKDHGHPELRLERGVDEAERVLERLAQVGISMEAVTERLEVEGVAAFAQCYDALLATVAARREAVLVSERGGVALGRAAGRVEAAVREMDTARVGARLWQRDPTLWKADDPKHQAEIADRFGWLALVERMEASWRRSPPRCATTASSARSSAAWAARRSPPRCSAGPSASQAARRTSRCSTPPTRPRSAAPRRGAIRRARST